MSLSEIASYIFIFLFSAIIAIRFYPKVVSKMSDEKYYEGKDYFPLENEMSDDRLMRPSRTRIEIIDRSEE